MEGFRGAQCPAGFQIAVSTERQGDKKQRTTWKYHAVRALHNSSIRRKKHLPLISMTTKSMTITTLALILMVYAHGMGHGMSEQDCNHSLDAAATDTNSSCLGRLRRELITWSHMTTPAMGFSGAGEIYAPQQSYTPLLTNSITTTVLLPPITHF